VSDEVSESNIGFTDVGSWEECPTAISATAQGPLTYTGNTGGALGWKVRGSLLADFEAVAYALEPSTTGNPKWGECKTKEGYHIIMVEGRK